MRDLPELVDRERTYQRLPRLGSRRERDFGQTLSSALRLLPAKDGPKDASASFPEADMGNRASFAGMDGLQTLNPR